MSNMIPAPFNNMLVIQLSELRLFVTSPLNYFTSFQMIFLLPNSSYSLLLDKLNSDFPTLKFSSTSLLPTNDSVAHFRVFLNWPQSAFLAFSPLESTIQLQCSLNSSSLLQCLSSVAPSPTACPMPHSSTFLRTSLNTILLMKVSQILTG